jgi:low temperature requirement protein LtrA
VSDGEALEIEEGDDEEAPDTLLRKPAGHAPVSFLELFFDLVYVFAITQLSHTLHDHMSLAGVIETGELFLAVWWAWIFTTWAANWANPERLPVRLMLVLVMLLSMLMAIVTPLAFGRHGMLFAVSYIALQLGRSLMMMAIFAREDDPVVSRGGVRNMARISAWFAGSGVPWIAGAMAPPELRAFWWAAALAIDYAGPLMFFWTPGLGRSEARDWDISGGHMAERGALFVIIALGEGVVVTGSTVSQSVLGGGLFRDGFIGGLGGAFLLAFAGSVLMWWLYFDIGAQRGTEMIEHHDEPGRIARAAYTYLHMPIIAGVIVNAVADALLLDEWHGSAERALVVTQCGSLILYVAGLAVFKQQSAEHGLFPLSHIGGLVMLVLLGAVALLIDVPALTFVAMTVAILAVVAVWEWVSFHGGWDRHLERIKPQAAT